MKLKAFKYWAMIALISSNVSLFAQNKSNKTHKSEDKDARSINIDVPDIDIDIPDIDVRIDLKDLEKMNIALADLDLKLDNLGDNLAETLKDISFDININDNQDLNFNSVEKTKTFSRSYTVNRDDKLAIDNQFGTIVINTWAKNEIKVDVTMKATEGSENEAAKLLEGININETKSNNLISLRTSIKQEKNNWGFRSGKDKRGIQINYTIYMPAGNPLDITNKFGGTVISDFNGVINVNSSYGSFSGKRLTNPANRIKVSYGSASIEQLKAGKIDVAYGSLDIENAERLSADIKYSSSKIGRLSGSGDFNIKYAGGFKIDEIDENLKDLNIDGAYSSMSLGFDPKSNFNFDVTVNYASFGYDSDKVNISSKTPDEHARGFNPSKNYKGTFGKGSDTKVVIQSNYGSVKFN
ncbi:hypothetical protein [Rubrolithibacter danxiaensis]|uniref:hypothetical protein n=1 Tax=Rubrolithibacter danxiaensis TaxID=3390805 RepID=UPI003BF81D29